MIRHQRAEGLEKASILCRGTWRPQAPTRELVSCVRELSTDGWGPTCRVGNRDEVGRASGGQIQKGLRRHLKQLDSGLKVMGHHCEVLMCAY